MDTDLSTAPDVAKIAGRLVDLQRDPGVLSPREQQLVADVSALLAEWRRLARVLEGRRLDTGLQATVWRRLHPEDGSRGASIHGLATELGLKPYRVQQLARREESERWAEAYPAESIIRRLIRPWRNNGLCDTVFDALWYLTREERARVAARIALGDGRNAMSPIYQLWRHVRSGDVYAVATDPDTTIVAAAGPLHHSEQEAALAGDFDDDPDVRDDLAEHSDEYGLVEARCRYTVDG